MLNGEESETTVVVLSLPRRARRQLALGLRSGRLIETTHRRTRRLKSGQSTVKVSYSPPSPQTCRSYIAFCHDY